MRCHDISGFIGDECLECLCHSSLVQDSAPWSTTVVHLFVYLII